MVSQRFWDSKGTQLESAAAPATVRGEFKVFDTTGLVFLWLGKVDLITVTRKPGDLPAISLLILDRGDVRMREFR